MKIKQLLTYLITSLWCWSLIPTLNAIPLQILIADAGAESEAPPTVFTGIAFRGAQTGIGTTTLSPLVDYPDDTQVDDIMICVFSSNAISTLSGDSLPAGWNFLGSRIVGTVDNIDCEGHVFWKRATVANPPSETWSNLFTGTPPTFAYGVVSYSGCITTGNPINASNSLSSGYNGTWSISVTTTVPSSMVVGIFCADTASNPAFYWEPSIISRVDFDHDTTGASSGYLTIGDSVVVTPGSKNMTGFPKFSDSYAAFAYSLTPAP